MDTKPEHYVYVFVREDLDEVDKIVQVGHACLMAGKAFFPEDNFPHNLVLFSVQDESELEETQLHLHWKGVNSVSFYEPDRSLGFTALVTEPVEGYLRNIFRKYSLHKSKIALN